MNSLMLMGAEYPHFAEYVNCLLRGDALLHTEHDTTMARKQTQLMIDAGRRLRMTREALNFETVPPFALVLNANPKTVYSWENGDNNIPLEKIKILKERFGITADWIYYGDPSALPRIVSDKLYSRAA